MALPPLNFETTVSPDGAKHDKIELGIEGGRVMGDRDDVWNFLHYLGSPPRDQRNVPGLGYGRYFSRLRESRERFNRESVRFSRQAIRDRLFSAGGQEYPRPLVRGEGLDITEVQGGAWFMEVCLSLNPTRFVRHQPMPSRSSLFQSPPVFPRFETNFFEREIEKVSAGEYALMDDDDNWIPNTRSWQRFASETFWPNHLRNCVEGLTQEVIQDLHRAEGSMEGRLAGQWRFNLHYVETYWEFLVDDPIGMVLRLQELLEKFSFRSVAARDYRCTAILETEENSRCLRLETRTGETLKFYAKTNHRIRFEVVHQLRGDNGFRVPRGGHTFDSTERVFRLLAHLTDVAAERVNSVLRHFQLHSAIPNHHSILKFIADFQAACGNPDSALQLLQILINNDSITLAGGAAIGVAFRRELDRLVRRDHEVLVRSNQKYSVAPPYAQALRIMQESGMGFLLGTRIRRKPFFSTHS